MSGQLSGFDFRPARSGDGEALFQITHRSISALGASHYPPEVLKGWMGQRSPAYYENEVLSGTITVAVRNDEAVGFVDAVPGEIVRLFLLPDCAGIGLGKALLTIGLQRSRQDSGDPVRVEATLNAESFYARHGFRRVGLGKFALQLGGTPIDIVHMELPQLE